MGCDCDRYVEFWNLVFTQFDSDGKGNYAPLDHPNIDTGMGLERLACIMQGVNNLFEVDTVQNIMKHVSRIAGVTYGENERTDVSLRVITDHIRSTTFMIGDGVMPSNEGRGYVLRRLLRRAARHGRLLGIHEPFLYQVCETVIGENRSAYPQLEEKKDFIAKLIHFEEEAFGKTIDSGLQLLDDMVTAMEGNTLSGEDAFRLYDTYGFPVDLTRDILEEKGKTVDEEGFERLMAEQRQRARAARKNAGADAWKNQSGVVEQLMPGRFVGYETLRTETVITAIIRENDIADRLEAGEEAALVLEETPFYAESGGQVGDVGEIIAGDAMFEVTNTFKSGGGVIVHQGVLRSGELEEGGAVTAEVNEETRTATMRNHTAAHLLQAALRQVLGTHVEQAGQLVDPQRMRFDFTHFSAMTAEELSRVEAQVNDWVLAGIPLDIREMPIEEARKLGAMALFGEKYGDIVRVVRVGEVSAEFCGGTHVENTGRLGLFRIVSESSVAAGVRRIEAVTGRNVLKMMDDYHHLMAQAAEAMKASNVEDIARRAAQLSAEYKGLQRKLEQIQEKLASLKVEGLFGDAKEVRGIRVVAAAFTGTGADAVRAMCEHCRGLSKENAVVVLAGIQEDAGSVSFGCYCAPEAIKRGAHAGNIVREVAAICGGRGGGRPDLAMAGGKDLSRVDDAINSVDNILEKLIPESK